MFDLHGMRYVVFGVANEKSICWAIAKLLASLGAEIIFVCHPSTLKRVQKLAESIAMPHVYTCDVGNPAEVETCFMALKRHASIYGVVHGIAFSDKDELRGRFLDTSRENFLRTMEISCYSFIEIARLSEALMSQGGSILTLTFDAADGPYPHYNIMGPTKGALNDCVEYAAYDLGVVGIRVNAISASPEDTLSARGIGNFRAIGDYAEAMSLLGRRATLKEIAQEAAYLLSPLSSAVTGQVRYVDCGASVPKMPHPSRARKMQESMRRIADIYEARSPQNTVPSAETLQDNEPPPDVGPGA